MGHTFRNEWDYFVRFCIIQERKSCLRFSIEVIIVKGMPEVKGTMVLQRHTFETGITLLIEVL